MPCNVAVRQQQKCGACLVESGRTSMGLILEAPESFQKQSLLSWTITGDFDCCLCDTENLEPLEREYKFTRMCAV